MCRLSGIVILWHMRHPGLVSAPCCYFIELSLPGLLFASLPGVRSAPTVVPCLLQLIALCIAEKHTRGVVCCVHTSRCLFCLGCLSV